MKRNKINWRVPKGMELTELDKKVLYYQDRGHLVPSRELIKTPEQIEGIRRSGIVNTGVLDLVEHEIHAGMSTLEIDKLVYEYTKDHGGIAAPLSMRLFVTVFPMNSTFWKKEILSMWIVLPFLMVIMPMHRVCLPLEKPHLKKKNWYE